MIAKPIEVMIGQPRSNRLPGNCRRYTLILHRICAPHQYWVSVILLFYRTTIAVESAFAGMGVEINVIYRRAPELG